MEVTKSWSSGMLRCAITHLLRHRRTHGALLAAAAIACATALLMLPGGMLPAQVISLLGLGGPSFPLANHDDHIHVGY